MKHLLIISFIFLYYSATAQNHLPGDGDYMDTTSDNTTCKDYEAYYYQVGGKYPKSSSTLLKETQLFLLNNTTIYTGSGYITFRFKIDCQGKMMHRVQVLQTDEKYNRRRFDKGLVNELFAFFKNIG